LTEKCCRRASGQSRLKGYVWIPLLLIIVAACSRPLSYPEAPRNGQDISIDISALQPGIPQYFSHSFSGMKIHFFVMKVEDRVISFLDACTKCYAQKKGFDFDSGSVVCRACNERYPVSEIERGFGSCFPIKLEGKMNNGSYLISLVELERLGTKFFR